MTRYALLKSLGKCPSHRTVDAVPGGVLCRGCVDQKSTRAAELKLKSLCIVCATPTLGGAQCENHRQKMNAALNALHQQRRQTGLCTQCGEESDPFALCVRCRLRLRIVRLDVLPEEKQKALTVLQNFDGHCQCCGGTDGGGRGWCFDHDHQTRRFRGIICGYCNAMLGMARDNIVVLLAGAKYLADRRNP